MMPMVRFILCVVLIAALVGGCTEKTDKEALHLEKARSFMTQQNYREAVLELRNVIRINPKNDAARLELGKAYMQLGEIPMAIESYDAAVKNNPDNVDAHIKMGQVLLIAQNTLNARRAAKIVLEKRPEDLDGMLLLAAVQVQEKNAPEAVRTLQETVAAHPDAIRARLFLATVLADSGARAEAEKTYQDAVSIDPAAAAPYIKLIKFYDSTGQWEKAPDALDLLLSKSREYDSELLDLAGLCERKKADDLAEKIYRHAVDVSPADKAEPLRSRAAYHVRKGDAAGAMADMEAALRREPRNIDLLTGITGLHLDRGELEAAAAALKQAFKIDPNHASSNYLRGVVAFQRKDYGVAQNLLDAAIKNAPDNAMAYYYKALCVLAAGAQTGGEADLFRAAAGYNDDADAWVKTLAEENLTKAIGLNPNLLPAKLVLAEIYLGNRNLEKARLQLDDILAMVPDQDKALTLQGSLKLLEQNYVGAEAVCKKALEKDPKNSQWLTRLGVVYVAMQRPGDAIGAFQRALVANPLQFDALELLIGTYVGSKDSDKALVLLESHKKILKDRGAPVAILDYMEGNVLLSRGSPPDARRMFQKAAEGSSEFVSPRMALAKLDMAEKRYDEAIEGLKGILKVNTNYLPVCMALGDIYYVKGDKKNAEKYYRAALKIDNGYGPAANNLAYVLSAYDNYIREALSLALTAVKKMPNDSGARDTLGWIHYRMGNYFNAITELKKSLSINPNNASASYHLGLAYYNNREFEKARQYVAQALAINPNFEDAKEAKGLLDKRE